ncbi:MAG: hypothetical protein WD826_03915 [Actinomycetota bacterium]
MSTHVELYEALKPYVGEEAAEMIAAAVTPASELATKPDIARLEANIDALRLEMKVEIAGLDARLSQRFMTFFIPLWIAQGSMIVALLGIVAFKL